MSKVLFRLIILLLTLILLTSCSASPPSEGSDAEPDTANITGDPPDEKKCGAEYSVSLSSPKKTISENLFGIFLEDINFAVDGGLYSELIKNRSFEYGSVAGNGLKHGWVASDKDAVSFSVTDSSPLNEANPHAALIENSSDDWAGILNIGYLDGLWTEGGKDYRVSVFLRSESVTEARVALEDSDGNALAEHIFNGITPDWQRFDAVITPSGDAGNGQRFSLKIKSGSIMADMVSLIPSDGWRGLDIRADIGERLEALKPSFLRFPGGCVIEGRDLESIYSWKDSIGNGLEVTINGERAVGDVSARPQGKSIWLGTKPHPYYTTYGIGFYEYFRLCEELGCLPLPVLNAGMTCEVQSPKYIVFPLSSDEFRTCVQDALDLVEFCRGGEDTHWGGVRIAMGHPEPFTLKYIGIGNEQWQTEYFAHYRAFVEAFQEAAEENPEMYGDIQLIVANGTMSGFTCGWDYVEDFCGEDDLITGLVDEHYYESPQWFLENIHRYDSYDRDLQAKVFLGEYAAQSNTLLAALSEAAYMTGLEKNGDVVEMACYAPLFGNSTQNQWTPDMIFFSRDGLYSTINYYVQQLFSINRGSALLSSSLSFDASSEEAKVEGGAGLGSWMTSVAYDDLKVVSSAGETLFESAFDDDSGLDEHAGDWEISSGRLISTNTGAPEDGNTGDAVYFGSADWSDYTLTVKGEILGGSEGFLIPVAVKDTDNCIFWNLGGWGNTVSCLQIISGGAKSGQVSGTIKSVQLEKNRTYEIKVEVIGSRIRCFLDGVEYIDYVSETVSAIYESAVTDKNGDIILKLINTTGEDYAVSTSLEGFDSSVYGSAAAVTTLSGDSLSLTNGFDESKNVIPQSSEISVSELFSYTCPPYSLSIIRIPHK